MDARSRRSQDALRGAVLALAGRMPIGDVTASAICAEAGITRDTFYRHTESPTALLADALTEEIAEVMEVLPRVEAIGDGERALIAHVQHRAGVYRGAMHPLLAAPLRNALDRSIREGLMTWARLHPHIVPAEIAADSAALRIAVAYAAAGTVGAIEEWLRGEDDDIDRAVRLILAASPEWWLR